MVSGFFFLVVVTLPWGRCSPAALEASEVVVVMHSGHPDRVNYTSYAKRTWLQKVPNYVIVDGMRTTSRRRLMHVFYDDNPGCATDPCPGGGGPHYLRIGKYYGAHRTVAGVLVANDTWPEAKWYLVVDDDDEVQMGLVRDALSKLDHRVPLLLAGRIGPGHDDIKCRTTSNATHWSCCTSASQPCEAHLYGPQAKWKYSTTHETFLPFSICDETKKDAYCCRASPWPEGINSGYPFRYDIHGKYRPHFSLMWPYGGLGYVLSRALLDAIPRDHWQMCMYGIQCANADHRIMQCVLNAGYSLTRVPTGIPGIKHHIKIPPSFKAEAPGPISSPSSQQQGRRRPHNNIHSRNGNGPSR